MTNVPNCAGVVLSGGQNTRMDGKNKSFLRLGKTRFLDLIIDPLSSLFDEIIIVTRQPELYHEWHVTTVTDIFDIRSPLAGIHAGLTRMKSDYAFVTSCDVPLLKKQIIQILVNAIAPRTDVVVPASGTFFQPLCAVYSKRCGPLIEKMLQQGEVKVDRLFDRVNVTPIDYAQLKAVDPDLNSFFNVNTKEDLDQAQRLIKQPGQPNSY